MKKKVPLPADNRLTRRLFTLRLSAALPALAFFGVVPARAQRRYTGITDSDPGDGEGYGRGRGTDRDPSDGVGRGRRRGGTDNDPTDAAGRGRGSGLTDNDPADAEGRGRGVRRRRPAYDSDPTD
jgi:hypothetical protein